MGHRPSFPHSSLSTQTDCGVSAEAMGCAPWLQSLWLAGGVADLLTYLAHTYLSAPVSAEAWAKYDSYVNFATFCLFFFWSCLLATSQ